MSSVYDAGGETQCINSQYRDNGDDNRGSPVQRISWLLYWLARDILEGKKIFQSTHIKREQGNLQIP